MSTTSPALTSRILSLPPEIFVQFFDTLPKSDLKRLRHVCRAFNHAAAPLLYDILFVSPQTADLAVLADLAARPAYAHNVKTLVYQHFGLFGNVERAGFWSYVTESHRMYTLDVLAKEIEEEGTQRGGKSAAEAKAARQERIVRDFEDLADKGFGEYLRYAEIQRLATCGEGYGQHLADVCAKLAAFPNIRTVVLRDKLKRVRPDSQHMPPRVWSRKDEVTLPFDSPAGRAWFRYATPPESVWMSSEPDDEYLPVEEALEIADPRRAFVLLMTALSLAAIRPSVFRPTATLPPDTFNLTGEDLQHARSVFECLKVIELDVLFAPFLLDKGRFGTLMAAAVQLEKLKFVGNYFQIGNESYVYPLAQLLGKSVWPNLHSLEITHMRLDHSAFLNLLVQQCPGLKHLRLQNVYMHEKSSWEPFSIAIRDKLQLLSLELEFGYGVPFNFPPGSVEQFVTAWGVNPWKTSELMFG